MTLLLLALVCPSLVIVGLVSAVSQGPMAPPERPSLRPTPAAVVESGVAPGGISLINEVRQGGRRCGPDDLAAASPVRWHPLLAEAARRHAFDLAGHGVVSHRGTDGSTPGQRAGRAGYAWTVLGEAIAAGQWTLSNVIAAWLRSPRHCAVLMGAEFADAGVAWALSPRGYRVYWVAQFGRPIPSSR